MSRPVGSSGRRRVISRSALVAAGIIIVVVVAVAIALWPRAATTLTHGDLIADPAFALREPASDMLLEVGSDAVQGVDGNSPAFAGHIFGTSATRADVYTFYERELARLGWRVETPPYSRSGVELENRVYCRAGAVFRLAIDDKNRAFQPSLYKGKDYLTVFDATLLAADPHTACPRASFTPFPSITR